MRPQRRSLSTCPKIGAGRSPDRPNGQRPGGESSTQGQGNLRPRRGDCEAVQSRRGGQMRSYRLLRRGVAGATLATLALPAVAMAQDAPAIETVADELNVTWILVAAVLVMFMQAGFAFLEIGFSRGEERRHGDRQDRRQLLDRFNRVVGLRVRVRVRRRRAGCWVIQGSSSTREERSARAAWSRARSAVTRPRSCSSSSCSARCRWRSSGARRSSGSSSART